MTKPYYTDPLKAAWMAREFGVKFDNGDSMKSALEACGSGAGLCKGHPFVVANDSLHIFEPQDGDLCAYIVIDEDGDILDEYEYAIYGNVYPLQSRFVGIIQRDGKIFFMPERPE